MSKKAITILGGLVLYLVSAGISFAGFRYVGSGKQVEPISPAATTDDKGRFKVDMSAPKTEVCPLTGAKFTKAEKEIWEKRRPLTVMIENHLDSRPQSGLSSADVVYEAVAEGGITRFLAVFYCGASSQEVTIGPVRSARTYFMDWASEYGDYPLYAHVGGANVPGPANALGQIGDYGWLKERNDLNQFALGFPTYWRDYERIGHEVATEHTMYSTSDKLWEVAVKRGLNFENKKGVAWNKNFESWKFKDEAKTENRGTAQKIDFNFWADYRDYAVSWQYDSVNNSYLRFNAGQSHTDLNNNNQVLAKVVIITFLKEKGPIDDLKHILYTTIGTGKAIVFQDGQATESIWKKKDRESRTLFFDTKGKEISLNRGPIWIEVVPAGKEVAF